MKQDQLIRELHKFIKLLPNSLLSRCVDSISFRNRDERRKYDKIKSLETKIETMLRDMYFRVSLIDKIHFEYNSGVVFDDSETYEEILNSINEENCISKIIYVLYKCCDESFDQLYFSSFIQSEPFQNTIKNEWNKTNIKNISDINLDNISKKNEEKKHMIWYLGYIELRTTYYNFKPQYIFNATENTISDITYDLLRDKFPEHGSINLAYRRLGDQAHEFLKSLNIDKIDNITDDTPTTSIFAIKLDDSDIEDNDNDRILKKFDLQKVYENGEDLSTRIKPVSEFKMFKIVSAKEKIENESFASIIYVNEKEYPAEELVLLEWRDNRLFGPYKLQERSLDGEKYIRPNSGSTQYVLEYYSNEDYKFFTFEKTPYMRDSIYTDVAYIYNSPRLYDAISSDVLLSKLVDSIDINLFKSNPEEFKRLYSASPFLGQLPAEIRNQRISRIEEILRNTTEYDDKKKKILETLLCSWSDNIFDLLGDKIKASKAYQDLQSEAKTLQDINAKLKAEKDELIESNKNLMLEKNQLEEEKANMSASFVDTTRIEELEKENAQLIEKVKFIENFDKLNKEYSELQTKHQQEKNLYDAKVIEVNKKKSELDEIQSKMKTFISDELTEADVTKRLRTAFDPYISNAMIEAAGRYQTGVESECYKKISNELSLLNCHEFGKDELIEKLVDGVQKYRRYSKNEILNIYVCLTQNFLTVFSGEPGTGKTSICNILASSLGLNRFGVTDGISKNRYIPVSVERGWSSKRDLIGYFNPLTKKYDRNNAKIYDGLMILNEERETSRFPYVILLDEANLSPIEYYWADFMRAADNTEGDIFINIGLSDEIYIPQTLRFLATINNDQTTERLSPRLIDRAWIIKLPKTKVFEPLLSFEDGFDDVILWSDIEKTFAYSDAKEMSLKNVAEQIYKLFDEYHLTVSPRVQQSIRRYVCVAQEIMEDEIGICNKKEKALDFAIVQKLLPKINGYYKDYERLFASLIQICDENHLKMTKEALISMEDFQRQNMGYCQYLV